MKRIHEQLMPEDIRLYAQDFDTPEHCKHAAKLMQRCLHGSEIHIRRKKQLTVITHYSADSFILQCLGLLDVCYKNNLHQPKWLWDIANMAAAFSRKRLLGFRPIINGKPVSCHDLHKLFYSKLGIGNEYESK